MNAIARANRGLEQLLRTVEERFVADNPHSRARHERACRVLPAGHSRQTLYYAPFPLTIARGSGARVVDLDGHDYLNLVGDYAAGVFGHNCEPIQRAVREALEGGVSLSGVNNREVELAELIAERIPSMEQVRFCNSGSEACLFAAQLARHASGRQKLLVFNGCYHGGFMIYGARDPALSVPFAVVKGTYNDVEGTRAILRANAPDIAAVIVEPMMGSAGCIPGTSAFLGMLREETVRLGVLLIFDEVMTSRLGPSGVQGLLGLRPDLTTLGKFWGGGFAFGAFGGARDLMRHFDTRSGGTLAQAGTFNNNIVAMTAGFVGARDVYTPAACTQLNAVGDRLRADLNALGRRHGLAFQSTGIGAVQNIHWSASEITEPSRVLPVQHPLRRLFHLELLTRGYYIAQRGMVNLSMPVTARDLESFLEAVDAVLSLHADVFPKAGATTTGPAGGH